VVAAPFVSSALFVGAHPDDETTVAGGTIALIAGAGGQVDVLLATAGEATAGANLKSSRVAELRREEARAACAILGARDPVVLDYPDGTVAEHIEDFAGEVARQIERTQPDVILVPWWLDGHPDHQAAAAAVALATVPASTEIWSGETWTPLAPNRLVDITETLEMKRAAIAAHRTAGEAIDLEALLGLNRYRSLRGLGGVGYAEAFVVTDPSSHRAIVGRLDD